MTDWLPWGLVLMVGTFSTLALMLRALSGPEGKRDVRPAWWALGVTVIASLVVYSLYVVFGECWLWYVRCR